MKKFGLIGKTLSHSFSREYFTEKFKKLKLSDHSYDLYELADIEEIESIFSISNLVGLNVTVPYKQSIIPYLDELDSSAERVGAVNVIRIDNKKKIGYNSDYLGFKISLANWIAEKSITKAIILGSGGASKAVAAALLDLGINYKVVSRHPHVGQLSYSEVDDNLINETPLIINTTPLGMSPDETSFPPINYDLLNSYHYLYDLVYNPALTTFLKQGQARGANIKNGLEMLHLQAEESWKIWNNN
jgi:shikimate dehydrogenase